MSTSLVHLERPLAEPPFALTQAQVKLRQMVLDSVQSVHSKRNYAKASMICLPSVPPTSLSCAPDGIPNNYGASLSFDHQCSDVSDPKAGGRSNTQRNAWRRRN
jgi:hypothetical protein